MTAKLVPITKNTRAPKKGRYIVCPKCEGASRVYNFAWSSLHCMYCKQPSDKYEWSVV
jgi:ribosomal protein S27E